MTRALGFVTCVLLLGGAARAEIVTINSTMDYADNGWGAAPYFVPSGEVLDHSPWHAASNQDWGWTHDLTGLVPKDATGIQSAALTIVAWDVDAEEGEEDVIYATYGEPPKASRTELGLLDSHNTSPTSVPWPATGQVGSYAELWSTTTFTLPKDVLDQLWKDSELDVFMDIDRNADGFRVTLEQSSLTVHYFTGTQVPEPATIALLGLGGLFALARRPGVSRTKPAFR